MFVQQMILTAVVSILVAPSVARAEYDPNNPFYPSPQRNLSSTLEGSDRGMARSRTVEEAARRTEERWERGEDGLSPAQREGLERKRRNTELERQGFTSRVP